MALFNIFKKDKEKKIAPKTSESSVKSEVKPKEKISVKPKRKIKKAVVKESPVVSLKSKKESEIACRVLKWPHVTEKATYLTKVNQYVFRVFERTNKAEIKKSVEDVYGAKVVSIKIINIHPKKRRLGRINGWRKGYKKAIVKLAKGQKIEILPI